MLKIAIIDTFGLTYDATTIEKRGLGGSESAVILISRELAKLGFNVTVYNNCIDNHCSPGVYEGVRYVDHEQIDDSDESYDIVMSSRSIYPFFAGSIYYKFIKDCKLKILWMHDTFCKGDEHIEDMVMEGVIDEIFTLSDFHTNYTLNNEHGKKRMFDVLKHKNWQTRNGAVKRIDEVDVSKKDRNHFVFNASVTKGLKALLFNVWPHVKNQIPEAHLTVIGGFYRFRENEEPDHQERDIVAFSKDQRFKDMGVTFTGVITQQEIANILANATFTIYPVDFPETFGISSLESLLYRTPLITNRFGALEETAIDLACYKVDYPTILNSLFPHINEPLQAAKFIDMTLSAYNNPYLLMQKQNYCDVVNDIHGWDSVAKQWRQHFYFKLGQFLPADQYREVDYINRKVARIFGRRFSNPEERMAYRSHGRQRSITVISPFYNSEDYIRNCILSVAQQDYENYRMILIDDASTDKSYVVAKRTIDSLPKEIQSRFILRKNKKNVGAVANQAEAIKEFAEATEIFMQLDGDDWLFNNNTLFHLYNDIYSKGYEFTYGSCWSLVDDIPLIAQDYPKAVKLDRSYRKHKFPWNMPYTHLRTFSGELGKNLNQNKLKDASGNWMRAGADGSIFYDLIEKADPAKIMAVKELVCVYNDKNPLNDYKINGDEQTRNANYILEQK